MLTQQLLAIIERTDKSGIQKVLLRKEHYVLHRKKIGDLEFDEALRTLLGTKFITAKDDALSGDTSYFITAKGVKHLA